MQDIIQCILNPAAVADTITKLSATTFAQPIEIKMLSVMVPLLLRGLRERNTPIKRKSTVIITNMVKLVEEPAHLAAFMSKLLPEVDKLSQEVSDPEARAVAVNAHALLVKAAGSEDGKAALQAAEARLATPEVRAPSLLPVASCEYVSPWPPAAARFAV
jgi:elongation factor 3